MDPSTLFLQNIDLKSEQLSIEKCRSLFETFFPNSINARSFFFFPTEPIKKDTFQSLYLKNVERNAIFELFKIIDRNQDSHLTYSEFFTSIKVLCSSLPSSHLKEIEASIIKNFSQFFDDQSVITLDKLKDVLEDKKKSKFSEFFTKLAMEDRLLEVKNLDLPIFPSSILSSDTLYLTRSEYHYLHLLSVDFQKFRKYCNSIDKNNDKDLSILEFLGFFEQKKELLDPSIMKEFKEADTDKNGIINYDEFSWWYGVKELEKKGFGEEFKVRERKKKEKMLKEMSQSQENILSQAEPKQKEKVKKSAGNEEESPANKEREKKEGQLEEIKENEIQTLIQEKNSAESPSTRTDKASSNVQTAQIGQKEQASQKIENREAVIQTKKEIEKKENEIQTLNSGSKSLEVQTTQNEKKESEIQTSHIERKEKGSQGEERKENDMQTLTEQKIHMESQTTKKEEASSDVQTEDIEKEEKASQKIEMKNEIIRNEKENGQKENDKPTLTEIRMDIETQTSRKEEASSDVQTDQMQVKEQSCQESQTNKPNVTKEQETRPNMESLNRDELEVNVDLYKHLMERIRSDLELEEMASRGDFKFIGVCDERRREVKLKRGGGGEEEEEREEEEREEEENRKEEEDERIGREEEERRREGDDGRRMLEEWKRKEVGRREEGRRREEERMAERRGEDEEKRKEEERRMLILTEEGKKREKEKRLKEDNTRIKMMKEKEDRNSAEQEMKRRQTEEKLQDFFSDKDIIELSPPPPVITESRIPLQNFFSTILTILTSPPASSVEDSLEPCLIALRNFLQVISAPPSSPPPPSSFSSLAPPSSFPPPPSSSSSPPPSSFPPLPSSLPPSSSVPSLLPRLENLISMVRENRGEAQIAVSTRYFKEAKLNWEEINTSIRRDLQVAEAEVKSIRAFSQDLQKNKEELEGKIKALILENTSKDEKFKLWEKEERRREEERMKNLKEEGRKRKEEEERKINEESFRKGLLEICKQAEDNVTIKQKKIDELKSIIQKMEGDARRNKEEENRRAINLDRRENLIKVKELNLNNQAALQTQEKIKLDSIRTELSSQLLVVPQKIASLRSSSPPSSRLHDFPPPNHLSSFLPAPPGNGSLPPLLPSSRPFSEMEKEKERRREEEEGWRRTLKEKDDEIIELRRRREEERRRMEEEGRRREEEFEGRIRKMQVIGKRREGEIGGKEERRIVWIAVAVLAVLLGMYWAHGEK